MEESVPEKWSEVSRGKRWWGNAVSFASFESGVRTCGEASPLRRPLLSHSARQSVGLECGHAPWYAWPTTSAACPWRAAGTTGQWRPPRVTTGPARARWSGLREAGVRWVARTGCVCSSPDLFPGQGIRARCIPGVLGGFEPQLCYPWPWRSYLCFWSLIRSTVSYSWLICEDPLSK